ncbi:hypothetical protein PtA15_7A614 [Puccinia triticina]|uniref:Uncharacterized protein n=1 Tax=Puccinia triticina TaxID=208348 RepID=A0ABY7CSZ6_9BASI|nr:uncharacterized protein PtA15_7A614 [Puccinia triticina]WAQ86885.1 hypothetical protein PtA15_7A614 [Puccinia triticina]
MSHQTKKNDLVFTSRMAQPQSQPHTNRAINSNENRRTTTMIHLLSAAAVQEGRFWVYLSLQTIYSANRHILHFQPTIYSLLSHPSPYNIHLLNEENPTPAKTVPEPAKTIPESPTPAKISHAAAQKVPQAVKNHVEVEGVTEAPQDLKIFILILTTPLKKIGPFHNVPEGG